MAHIALRLPDSERFARLQAEKARVRHWQLFWDLFSIEHARFPAAVVLDAHLIGNGADRVFKHRDIVRSIHGAYGSLIARMEIPSLCDWLLKLALIDYKIRFPKARGDKLYVYRGPVRGGGDIFCRFCGARLRSRARNGRDYMPEPLQDPDHDALRAPQQPTGETTVQFHVTTCALQCLAKTREAISPRRTKRNEFRGRNPSEAT